MTKMSFEEFAKIRYNTPPYDFWENPQGFPVYSNGRSDVSAHLPLLEMIAKKCDHCTEFGTRDCFSTSALIKGCRKGGKVISYDIIRTPSIDLLEKIEKPCEWKFIQQSTVDPNLDIEDTDLLFIDSLHENEHVRQELKQTNKVRKYIIMHDVYSQWDYSLDCPGKLGIGPAITEFFQNNTIWQPIYRTDTNHGLLVLEKENNI